MNILIGCGIAKGVTCLIDMHALSYQTYVRKQIQESI